jgi:hypothetical protein
VLGVAQRRIRMDDLSVVVVGDASKVEAALRETGIAPLTVIPADEK